MTNPAPDWWYASIWAAPRPEMAELVSIGVLLGRTRAERVEFLPGLPRLSGLVASDELAVFMEIMNGVRGAIDEGADVTRLGHLFGPQLRFGEPKQLYTEPDQNTVDVLARNLLESPRIRKTQADRQMERAGAEHELDRLIGGVVPAVGLRMERRPTLQKLYERLPAPIVEARLPSLARALRSQERDVLIDSVLVQSDDPLAAIRTATTRVGRAFWYYKKLRPELERVTGRQIRTVGVLLNGTPHKTAAMVEVREYIAHIWRPDADLVIDVEHKADIETLRRQLHWLTE